MAVLFYQSNRLDPDLLVQARGRSPDYAPTLWRPGVVGQGVIPPDASGLSYRIYGAMHKLGLFANTDYSALLLAKKNHQKVEKRQYT